MENQKTKIISIASIIALALTLVTATFAYFMAQTGEGKSTDIKINANTVDTLTFEAGSALNLSLNQENFASGKGNQTGTTFAKAMLTANNKTNTATEHYYMYLNISENTFTYTQNENTPEILLTIKDASGNEIKSITGLTHKTVTDGKGTSISGFDITTKSEVITLFNNREITATPAKTEEWNITVTFVNYNADQSANAGKSFNAKLMIQQESQSNQTLADYVISQYTGTQGDNALYYHTSTLDNGAGDNSYRYAGANPNNYVCFGSDASPCPEDNLYRIIGVFGNQVKLIKATIAKSNLLGTDGAYDYDTSYRWSSLISCPSSTAYNSDSGIYQLANKNIIAVQELDNGCNEWNYSNLNTTNLNTNFINNIGTAWADKIATTTWKVGGDLWSNIVNSVPKTAYKNEVGSSASTITVDKKIGLMYVTDYYYSASPSAWTLVGYNKSDATKDYRAATSTNWLYLGSDEWTISRCSDDTNNSFGVHSLGYVSNCGVTNSFAVRPSFNLLSSVKYVSGSGSMSDPVRVN